MWYTGLYTRGSQLVISVYEDYIFAIDLKDFFSDFSGFFPLELAIFRMFLPNDFGNFSEFFRGCTKIFFELRTPWFYIRWA